MSEVAVQLKPIRHRSPNHLSFVRTFRCCACIGMAPNQAHHITTAQPKARGLKSGDQYTVPLCNGCHLSLHAKGDETAWWDERGIDPLKLARQLWEISPGKLEEFAPQPRRKPKPKPKRTPVRRRRD